MTDILPTPGMTGDTTYDELRARQQELRQAKEAMAGEIPLIPDAPGTTITLPRGLWNGSWQTKAQVRELTGVDEEALAKAKDPADVFDTVLGLGTQRIGSIELTALSQAEREGTLRQLLLGERDQLFMAVVQATFGDVKKLSIRCTACNADQELVLTLSEDFKPREVTEVDGASFTYTSSKGDVIQYHPVTGDDQAEALRRKGASTAEQNTILLSQVIDSVNGKDLLNPVDYARGMSMLDRQKLLIELAERQPSIDLTVSAPCAECREEQTLILSWVDIFRP